MTSLIRFNERFLRVIIRYNLKKKEVPFPFASLFHFRKNGDEAITHIQINYFYINTKAIEI